MHNHVLCICCGKDVKSKILVNIVEGAMNKIKLDILQAEFYLSQF